MKNETLYHKTVDILVQAYFNDTLQHRSCAACAVGNIIAANMGLIVICGNHGARWKERATNWSDVFITYFGSQRISVHAYKGEAKEEINSTGYNFYQLAKIEHAFETASRQGDYMFNGLMAVIDQLDIIHENTDTATTKATKNKFTHSLPALK